MKHILWLIIVVASATSLYAEHPKEDARYDALKAQYLHLRNTDDEFQRAREWDALARDLNAFVNSSRKSDKAPAALFLLAVLEEQRAKRTGEERYLAQSLASLNTLITSYPWDSLADDALVRKGDLLRVTGEAQEAQETYQSVLDNYQRSDMLEVARARLNPDGQDSSAGVPQDTHKRGEVLPVIVVDPGHGGEDFGAKGVGGLLEKDVTLAVALELEKILSKQGVSVKLTRRRDEFVPLSERIQLANDYEAKLFISLHTNASPKSKLSGLETFYLDNSGDEASRLLAERENSSLELEEQGDLQFILSDLIQNAKLEDSIALANVLHRTLATSLKGRFKEINDFGVRKAPFYVLVGAHMPCALIELFFIDHVVDGARLGSKDFRQELARGLSLGVKEFLRRG